MPIFLFLSDNSGYHWQRTLWQHMGVWFSKCSGGYSIKCVEVSIWIQGVIYFLCWWSGHHFKTRISSETGHEHIEWGCENRHKKFTRYAFFTLCSGSLCSSRSSLFTCSIFWIRSILDHLSSLFSFCGVQGHFFVDNFCDNVFFLLEAESGEHIDMNEKIKHVKSSSIHEPVKVIENIVPSVAANKHLDIGTSKNKLPLQPAADEKMFEELPDALGPFIQLCPHSHFYFFPFLCVLFPGFTSALHKFFFCSNPRTRGFQICRAQQCKM